MTDANLGDIVVVGQRRRPGGTFPGGGGSGGGGGTGNDTTPREVSPEDTNPPTQPHPCDHPDTALNWNADAAAAEAKRQFERKAVELGDDGLYEREFGAQLYQRPDGTIYVGAVTFGERLSSTVTIDESNPLGDLPIGEVHSHNGGTRIPSTADWARVDVFSGRTGQNYRSYIVARDTRDVSSDFAIRAYDTTSDRNIDVDGPEVNPDGQPCS